MERLTIREAARELGITPQALRSRARHRGIPLEKVPGPHGERYLVNTTDLPLLQDETVSRDGSKKPFRETVPSQHGTVSSHGTVSHEIITHEIVPLPAHLEVLHLLRDTQHRLQEAQQDRHTSQEGMRLLERQVLALQWELTGYRQALSENAESLAERSASTQQVEIEKSALAEENMRQREEFEREKATLTEGLLQTQARVRWLEQRVPSWIRRLLGAG